MAHGCVAKQDAFPMLLGLAPPPSGKKMQKPYGFFAFLDGPNQPNPATNPPTTHKPTTIFLQISYNFPTDFLQISYNFPTDFLQISYNFPTDFPTSQPA